MNEQVDIKHFHLFCGLGGGAKGFNDSEARVGNLQGNFKCIGGVDVDPASIYDFERLSGTRGTVLDMFSREQYIAFHGKEPDPEWKEATAFDIQMAAGGERPNIIFLSAPCKGFSGLLSQKRSKTNKYQALNELTLRGMWLALEAYRDDPVEFYVFENVPRITSRGRHLLDQIISLLRSYGYAVAESSHDCGELGGLAQSRKRFLLVARHEEKIPPFLYEPEKKNLKAVGDILGRMPMPGDLDAAGPMHRVPRLQWKTWVRLAFVQAGGDWRSLNRLEVEDGVLSDFLIMPENKWDNSIQYGVTDWNENAGTVTAKSRPGNGKFSVADPRTPEFRPDYLGVRDWKESTNTIAGRATPTNGAYSIADPRFKSGGEYSQYGIKRWTETAATVTSQRSPGQGPFSVADPRHHGAPKHNNCFRIVEWDKNSMTVTGAGASQQCVADPRPSKNAFRKYQVSDWNGKSGTVIGGDDNGAYGIADPRPNWQNRYGNMPVIPWEKNAPTVHQGGKGVQGGALSVADPRVLNRKKGDNYLTGGHYGVLPWNDSANTISASGRHDNGYNSVADPRIPKETDQLVCMIKSLDGTWHRPFTTLELAALQSLVDPEEHLELHGMSDGAWRERIGNAVPPRAAAAIGSVMGTTFLLAMTGTTFSLSSAPIWVRDVAVGLTVNMENAA